MLPTDNIPICTWRLTIAPPVQCDLRWNARLIERVRPVLEARLNDSPSGDAFTWKDGPLEIHAHHESGHWLPGTSLQFTFPQPDSGSGSTTAAGRPRLALPQILLPNEDLSNDSNYLVGLEDIVQHVLVNLHCHFGNGISAWSAATGQSVPPVFRDFLARSLPLFVFAGCPGTGKTTTARVITNRFCIEHQIGGLLLAAGTQVRGQGLVGDASARARDLFAQAERLAADGPVFLLIDEGESVAVRRSETQAHHEDRALTATLLQCLDGIAGRLPIAIFLTTNLLPSLDPALLRRSRVYRFPRPGYRARSSLLKQWFPDLRSPLRQFVGAASAGMTPADIHRALEQAHFRAIAAKRPLNMMRLLWMLATTSRTEEV